MSGPVYSPPRLAEQLLRNVLRPGVTREGALGDLREEYARIRMTRPRVLADTWYWWNSIQFYRRFHREISRMAVPTTRSSFPTHVLALVRDLRQAARGLWKRPGFTSVAVLTLALGVGATTTIFSFVHGMLLRPLQYPEQQELVAVWPSEWFSLEFFEFIEERLDSYTALAGWNPRSHVMIRDGIGATELSGPRVTPGFFDVLGVPAGVGRTFLPDYDSEVGDNVIVISERLWRQHFGATPDVIGRELSLRGDTKTIVGVMPAGFDFVQPDADVVILKPRRPGTPGYQSSEMKLIGRLAPGVTIEQANADLDVFVATLREDYNLRPGWGADAAVVPYAEFLTGGVRPLLGLLFGAVGIILIIAAANLASLFLARAITRTQELSIRLSLGAGRAQIIRYLLAESLVVGAVAVIPAMVLALAGVDGVKALLPAQGVWPQELPRLNQVAVNWQVALFGTAIGVLVATVANLAAGITVVIGLQVTGPGAGRFRTASRARRRAQSNIVGLQVALAVVLLTGSGLLIKSFLRLSRVDPGFETSSLLGFELSPESWRGREHAEVNSLHELLQARLEAIPGVVAVSSTSDLPFSPDGGVVTAYPANRPPGEGEERTRVRWRPVTVEFFTTAGIPLLYGRGFDESDVAGGPAVGMISRTTATVFFGDQDPIGEQMLTGFENVVDDPVPFTVVGVVGDVRALGLDQESPATVYRPYSQLAPILDRFGWSGTRSILLRTAGDPYAVVPQIRHAVLEEDPNALLSDIRSMPDAIADSMGSRRALLVLVCVFALTALVLMIVGVYGLTAFTVRSRSREIGIRVALGATTGRVTREVVAGAARLAVFGGVAGALISLLASQSVRSQVYGVSTSDPWVLGGASFLAMGTVLLAGLGPARRAGRVDVVKTLSEE